MKSLDSTIGRRRKETEDTLIKDPFENDVTKIRQAKAYRRLDSKAQVLCSPINPHIRTRLFHTGEVVCVGKAISGLLGLNTNLVEAIAEGHDIGHTPYGHEGERILTELGGKPFKHYVNSVVVAQKIERKGKGLNLTFETLEGMLKHSRAWGDLTVDTKDPMEYSAAMFADKIAYTLSDLNDAVREGFIKADDIPACARHLGSNQRARTVKVVKALVDESRERGYVRFSEGEVFEMFTELKHTLEEEFYKKVDVDLQRERLMRIYNYIVEDRTFSAGINPILAVSLLTDREVDHFATLLNKSTKPPFEKIDHFGIFEVIPYIRGKDIDYTDPDLDKKDFNQHSGSCD